MNQAIRNVQRELNARGFNAGPEDGVRGRRTIMAIKAFQQSKGLTVDGIVGLKTRAELFGSQVRLVDRDREALETPWISEVERIRGLHEVRNNSVLRRWLRLDGASVGDPAKIPWCGDLVQTAIALSLPDEPIPENPYLAANWLKFGKRCKPQRGAVLVFWRGSPSSWKGHVGFYVGEDATHYHVLGGNQSNAVTVTRIAKSRLRAKGCRWPLTAMDGDGRNVYADAKGLVTTTNEA